MSRRERASGDVPQFRALRGLRQDARVHRLPLAVMLAEEDEEDRGDVAQLAVRTALTREAEGASPSVPAKFQREAQLDARCFPKAQVAGSSPAALTTFG